MTHTDDVDPTEWADQIIYTTKPSRTLRGADAAASGRAALEAAGVDLSALEQRIAKGGRPGLDGHVTGVEEDEALQETAYLLRSPVNAQRLRDADAALRAGRGVSQELDRA